MRVDLGLTPEQRQELTQNLNIVINCAASVNLADKLDVATKINVTGALRLFELAQES